MNKPLQRTQLNTLLTVSLLSPLIRQMPTAVVRSAGAGAWLSALLAVPVLLALGWMNCDLLRGRDLFTALEQSFGRRLGRVFVWLITGWLLFYLGFVLRSGADRFVTTVYPEHSVWVFVAVLSAMALIIQTGTLRQLGRMGQAVEPFLLFFFLVLPFLVLPQVEWAQVRAEKGDLPGLLRGIFPIADTLCVAVYGGFLEDRTEGECSLSSLLRPLLALTALTALLCLSTVGVFGVSLTEELYYPFFVLLRNVQLTGFLERVEAALVAQWAAVDLILCSLLLWICQRNLSRLGFFPERKGIRLGLCLLLALSAALLCAGSSYALLQLTERVVPPVNAALVFVLVPLCWGVGKIKSRG